MRKLTAFGLGIVAGALGTSFAMWYNADHIDQTLYENDEMIIRQAGYPCMNVNSAVVEYKNKEEA